MLRAAAELSRIELLVLARLSGQKKPPGPAKIATDFAKLVIPAASRGEWETRLRPLFTALQDRGLIDARRRLTDEGRAMLRKAFGTTKVPGWDETRNRLMPALALGGDGAFKIAANGEKLQAALTAMLLGLKTNTTAARVLDDFVGAKLGLPPGKLTMERIRAHMLSQHAGVSVRGNAEQMATQIAARAVRAPRGDVKELRTALVRRWLTDGVFSVAGIAAVPPPESEARSERTPSPRREVAQAVPPDDQAFDAMVHDAIRGIGPEGRFGPYKVFVSAIWRRVAEDPRCRGMTFDDLKLRLLDANRADRLSLARADLVGAMDRKEVAASEIFDRGASFHFVLDAQRLP